jgi:hypothetical protein
VKILCPTCQGKGTIGDPKCIGRPLFYYNPLTGDSCPLFYYNPLTGDSCPQVICQSCSGEGWVPK